MINKALKKHHVYMYRSPIDGVPIYVGKGWGDRAWQHLEIAARNPEQHSNKRFARTLAKWLREGHRIEPSIVQVFETHEEALDHEVELIRLYGRSDIKTGTLFNLTDGGEGTAGRGLQVEVEGINYPTYREVDDRFASRAVPLPTNLAPFAAAPMHRTSASQYDSPLIG